MAGSRVTCVQEELLLLTSGFREIRHGRCIVGNTEVLYAGPEDENIATLSTDQ
jgi:hypothetical protein